MKRQNKWLLLVSVALMCAGWAVTSTASCDNAPGQLCQLTSGHSVVVGEGECETLGGSLRPAQQIDQQVCHTCLGARHKEKKADVHVYSVFHCETYLNGTFNLVKEINDADSGGNKKANSKKNAAAYKGWAKEQLLKRCTNTKLRECAIKKREDRKSQSKSLSNLVKKFRMQKKERN